MPPSLKILGSRVDPVSTQHALEQIQSFLAAAGVHHVITGNTLMVLEAQRDRSLRDILEQASLVVPESWGIRWAARLQRCALSEFTPGIDLMLAICRLAEISAHSMYLLGSAPGVAHEAGQALRRRFPALKVAGTGHGYFALPEEPEVIHRIRQTKPSLLFVGMGMPAQEKWIAAHLQELGVPVVMGVGGSFDVLSGRLARAPEWVRSLGVEWSYRLFQEPWRWRRIVQLPVFAWKVWWETKHGKR